MKYFLVDCLRQSHKSVHTHFQSLGETLETLKGKVDICTNCLQNRELKINFKMLIMLRLQVKTVFNICFVFLLTRHNTLSVCCPCQTRTGYCIMWHRSYTTKLYRTSTSSIVLCMNRLRKHRLPLIILKVKWMKLSWILVLIHSTHMLIWASAKTN